MPDYLRSIVSNANGEWSVIARAPATFLFVVSVMGVGIWAFCQFHFRGIIETLRERIELHKDKPGILMASISPPSSSIDVSPQPVKKIQTVPKIGGIWVRKDDDHPLTITQNGDDISFTGPSETHEHKGTAIFDDVSGKFLYSTVRTRADGSDRAVMRGTWQLKDADTLRVVNLGVTKGSELPTNYYEDTDYHRMKG